jgi:hypothetical protein
VNRPDDAFTELYQAMEAFAADRAPGLIAEAEAEALAKVRSMLVDAISESLLERAQAHLVGGRAGAEPLPPSGRRRAPRPTRQVDSERTGEKATVPERSSSDSRPPEAAGEPGYYVYGIAEGGAGGLPEQLPGVDPNHAASLIEEGGLAAIVSLVSLAEFGEEALHENLNDVAWLEDKARAHEQVLDAALSRMTVVPMRLCTIYRSASQVREMLRGEHDVFADALRRLQGKTEWGVKLLAEPRALERAAGGQTALPGGSEGGGLSTGTDYMRQKGREARVRHTADQIAELWAQSVHERVAAVASEALQNPLQNPEVSGHTGEMLLNGVYLVDEGAADQLRDVVAELSEEYRGLGATVQLTGPWPPYNFVKSSIEAAR